MNTISLTPEIIEVLLNADGKALASGCGETIHVVPVSSIRVVDGTIQLVNYFFGQTLSNITTRPEVALAAWRGLEGYQIKATAQHVTEGQVYDEVTAWIADTLPDRVVKGVVMLTPHTILDVSADPARAGKQLSD